MSPSLEPPEAVLTRGLAALTFSDVSRIVDRLMAYGALLLQANRSTNLIGAADIHKVVVHHFLDSLAPFSQHRFRPPIIDLGSGAGLPGIPVAIAFPRAPITLMEPRRLRADFLESTVRSLGLENVEVVRSAAESAGRSESRRERAGTVLARAVGKPAVTLELGLPLLKRAGSMWLYQGRDARPSQDTLDVASLLGGALVSAQSIAVPGLDAERHLWVFRKVRPTPDGYPRRSRSAYRIPVETVK